VVGPSLCRSRRPRRRSLGVLDVMKVAAPDRLSSLPEVYQEEDET
jgi:hypothetical protein